LSLLAALQGIDYATTILCVRPSLAQSLCVHIIVINTTLTVHQSFATLLQASPKSYSAPVYINFQHSREMRG